MKYIKPKDINEYIAAFPAEVQAVLEEVRAAVQEAAPGAEEAIKYDMPTFVWHGNLVHFAAFKRHIGFYSVPTGEPGFIEDLRPYRQGKGSIQFPLDKPMPLALIGRIVR